MHQRVHREQTFLPSIDALTAKVYSKLTPPYPAPYIISSHHCLLQEQRHLTLKSSPNNFSAMTSTRYATALKYIKAAKDFDLNAIMALRTPTCTHHLHPSSLGTRVDDNAAYETHLLRFKSIITGFPIVAKEIIEDEKQNRVVLLVESGQTWVPAAMDPSFSEEEWGFKREYVFILSMDESQEKVEKVIEFLDSKGTDQFRALITRAFENIKK